MPDLDRVVRLSAASLCLAAGLALLPACGGGGGDGDSGESSTETTSNEGSNESSGGGSSASNEAPSDPTEPPNKARVEADIRESNSRANDILSIEFRAQRGKKSWSPAHSQYFYEFPVTIRRKANLSGLPDAVVQIGGFARYEITGGRYDYREFKVYWNEYEGMPNPTDDELMAFVEPRMADIFRGLSSTMVDPDSFEFGIPEDPDVKNWEWHTANSFSVNFATKLRQTVSYTEVSDFEGTIRVRFYRDAPDQPWKNCLQTGRELTETGKTKYTSDEVNAMPRGMQWLSGG